MCRLGSRSVCFVLLLTGLACADTSGPSGDKADAGSAAGGGGASGAGGAGGKNNSARDAGDDASAYSNGGTSGSAGKGGAGGSLATKPDVKPAECLPDPTDFTPCGGDVVGKWRNASFCLDSGIDKFREEFSCPDITQDFNVDYRMLVQFKANGDYLADFSSDVTQNLVIPKSCLGGSDADCLSLLGPDDTDPNDDGSTLIVRDSGNNCSMDAEQHLIQNNDTGSFTTDGTMITVRDADGPDTSEYCVNGDKLTVKTVGAVSGKVNWGQFTRE